MPNFCLEDVLRAIVTVLGTPGGNSNPLSENDHRKCSYRALATEPRLLIIDNFETVTDESLHMFLRDLPSPSKVLITSRHHIHTGEMVITLGGLGQNDAVKLLHLEAHRLQIPIQAEDTERLELIAKKSYGVPLLLRWIMESVYNGKSLESALHSVEHATADDVFDFVFQFSLSTLTRETRSVFQSLSVLVDWAGMETLVALNPGVAAVPERIGELVTRSLVEDNRMLVLEKRRYKLHPFARSLSSRELATLPDKGATVVDDAVSHYLAKLSLAEDGRDIRPEPSEEDISNIKNIVGVAANIGRTSLLRRVIELAARLRKTSFQTGTALLVYLREPVITSADTELLLAFLAAVHNPYFVGPAVHSHTMFFGRKEILAFLRDTFDSSPNSFVSLSGPRRIGKTSLLIQLLLQGSQRCIYAYADLQAAYSDGIDGYLRLIASAIGRALKEAGIAAPAVNMRAQGGVLFESFGHFMTALPDKLLEKRFTRVP